MSVVFEPLYDRVLIKPLGEANAVGDVLLPETTKEDYRIGTVVAVGEGYMGEGGKIRPLKLVPGDKVLFPPYIGIPMRLSGEEFLSVQEVEIAGRLREIPDAPAND